MAALAIGGQPAAAQEASTGTGALAGLWTATRDFGPQVRGPLEALRTPSGFRGEIAGFAVAASGSDDLLRFAVPGDRGEFRGRFSVDSAAIAGHWVQPRTFRSFAAMATPVILHRQAAGHWTGEVEPLDDRLDFILDLRAGPDGELGGYLRNPQANLGRFYPFARVVRDGSHVAFLDADGRERLVGRYDPQFDRLSVYFPLNGGTFDFERAGEDAGSLFLPRPPGSSAYEYRLPVAADGWDVARPEDVGMAPDGLRDLVRAIAAEPVDAIDAPYVHGVLVARGGKLVLEEYFHGFTRHEPHGTRSASKSITATLAGIAVADGRLTPETRVYATLTGEAAKPSAGSGESRAPLADGVTLAHLVSMTSGLACDDRDPDSPGGEDAMQEQEEQPDWTRFMLALPMRYQPGTHAAYCSGGMHLAGTMVANAYQAWLPDVLRARLAEPLEMGRYHVNLSPTGNMYGGGGMYVLPRDLLKLGQLYLQGGMWEGRRLVDAAWAAEASRGTVSLGQEQYGNGWWSIRYPFARDSVRAFYAGGNGGQYVIVVPELELVVVFLGGNYNQRVMHRPKYEYVPRYVLSATTRELPRQERDRM